jgi:hypothetical protein
MKAQTGKVPDSEPSLCGGLRVIGGVQLVAALGFLLVCGFLALPDRAFALALLPGAVGLLATSAIWFWLSAMMAEASRSRVALEDLIARITRRDASQKAKGESHDA